uniref:Uncharacterized protein n=1 Tax=Oryctolagus cuniculus TaxID=9986 RepID=A0A5F9CFP2_RABIT
MDTGPSEDLPVSGSQNYPTQPLKPRRTSNNILNYLISRQLGISRNHVDLSQWAWMLMCETPGCSQPWLQQLVKPPWNGEK